MDGDTIEWGDGRRVRLSGVDTPEWGRPGSDQATRATAAFLERGGGLALVPPEPTTDRYGRLLADVTVGGESLSEHLLGRGLAWLYRGDPGSWLDTQRRAVEHRRGVHHGLDSWAGGVLVITASSFHDPRCRLLGPSTRARMHAARPGSAFKQGLAPCRGCLPWPPLVWTTAG